MRGPVATLAVVLGGCMATSGPRSEAIAVLAASSSTAIPVASGPRPRPYCATTARREASLVAAWPAGERMHFCVEQAPTEGQEPMPLQCASLGPDGDYRIEDAIPGAPPPMPHAAFRDTSLDGALSFRLTGGEREPKGARGTLLRHGKVVRSAPITYDEHVELEGWMGNGVILRTWVDEGPGCNLQVVDPRVEWPSTLWSENSRARSLGGCFGGLWTWKPTHDTYVLLDGQGAALTFVDEKTLGIEQLDTERQGGPEEEKSVVPWLRGDELVMVYGAPIAGDVVKVSLGARTLDGFSPTSCEGVE